MLWAQVQRVEHSARWLEYIAQREEIRKGMNNECLTVEPPVYTVSEAQGPDADIPSSERLELDTGVNEVYLWHGTSTEHVDQIIECVALSHRLLLVIVISVQKRLQAIVSRAVAIRPWHLLG